MSSQVSFSLFSVIDLDNTSSNDAIFLCHFFLLRLVFIWMETRVPFIKLMILQCILIILRREQSPTSCKYRDHLLIAVRATGKVISWRCHLIVSDKYKRRIGCFLSRYFSKMFRWMKSFFLIAYWKHFLWKGWLL